MLCDLISKILPLEYDNSLSYMEMICSLMRKINDIISNINTTNDTIKTIKENIELVNKEIAKLEKDLKESTSYEYLEPIIVSIINDMVKEGLLIVNSRWVADNSPKNKVPLPTSAEFNFFETTLDPIKYNKIVTQMNKPYSVANFKKIYPECTSTVEYLSDGIKITQGETVNTSYIILGDEFLRHSQSCYVKAKVESVTGVRQRIGFALDNSLIYYDFIDKKIYYENTPSFTKTELFSYDSTDILLMLHKVGARNIDVYINGLFAGNVSNNEDTTIYYSPRIMTIMLNSSIIIEDVKVIESAGYTFKDCSYIRNIDGSLFTANNRAYISFASEFHSGGGGYIMSHTLGLNDFKYECNFNGSVVQNILFDPSTRKFLFLWKDWGTNELKYSINTINSFNATIHFANASKTLKPSSNPNIFGTSEDAEDIDAIVYNNELYVCYCRKGEGDTTLSTYIFKSDAGNLDLNSHSFIPVAQINDNTTGNHFCVFNEHLYLCYGSTNSLKLFDVTNKKLVGELQGSFDNRVWGNIAQVDTGTTSRYYITTFSRDYLSERDHSYGAVRSYISKTFYNGNVTENYIGIR